MTPTYFLAPVILLVIAKTAGHATVSTRPPPRNFRKVIPKSVALMQDADVFICGCLSFVIRRYTRSSQLRVSFALVYGAYAMFS